MVRAHGIRKINSRRAGSLDTLNLVKVSITHPENSEGSDLEVILQGNCENQRVLYRLEGGKCLRDFQRSTKEGERLGDSNLGLSESIDELADISLALKFAS